MLGVGLRKLCPQDSFGYACRKKNLNENRPPRRVQNRSAEGPTWLVEGLRNDFFVQVGPIWPPRPLRCRLWAQNPSHGRTHVQTRTNICTSICTFSRVRTAVAPGSQLGLGRETVLTDTRLSFAWHLYSFMPVRGGSP